MLKLIIDIAIFLKLKFPKKKLVAIFSHLVAKSHVTGAKATKGPLGSILVLGG